MCGGHWHSQLSICDDDHFPETKGYCWLKLIQSDWSMKCKKRFPCMTFIYLVAFVSNRAALYLLIQRCEVCLCSFLLRFHCWPQEGTPHHSCTFNPIWGCCSIFCVSKLGRLGEPVVLHLAAQSSFTGTLVLNPHSSDHCSWWERRRALYIISHAPTFALTTDTHLHLITHINCRSLGFGFFGHSLHKPVLIHSCHNLTWVWVDFEAAKWVSRIRCLFQ